MVASLQQAYFHCFLFILFGILQKITTFITLNKMITTTKSEQHASDDTDNKFNRKFLSGE
jgi:hypothetical protein